MARRLYDISPVLNRKIPVWPGDTEYHLKSILSIRAGQNVNLGTVTMSLHTGAHVDAPWHYSEKGQTVEQLGLEPFLGKARLISLSCESVIQAADLREPLKENSPRRILVRTDAASPADRFPKSFVFFSPEAAHFLGRAGIILIGTNAPSVDHFSSQDLPAHQAFGKHRIQIMENLMLDDVPEGEYELIALPLRLEGADGSPVRAVLREI